MRTCHSSGCQPSRIDRILCNPEAARALEDFEVTEEQIYPHWAIMGTFSLKTIYEKVNRINLPKEIPVNDMDKEYIKAAAKEAKKHYEKAWNRAERLRDTNKMAEIWYRTIEKTLESHTKSSTSKSWTVPIWGDTELGNLGKSKLKPLE